VAPGSIGTLTELYLTWTLISVQGRAPAPLVLLGPRWQAILDAHRGEGAVPEGLYQHVQVTRDPLEAARLALTAVAPTAGSR
jgi:predicted Rossmann-fold nucleotide-binding protein